MDPENGKKGGDCVASNSLSIILFSESELSECLEGSIYFSYLISG
jgi:hypothetical protein